MTNIDFCPYRYRLAMIWISYHLVLVRLVNCFKFIHCRFLKIKNKNSYFVNNLFNRFKIMMYEKVWHEYIYIYIYIVHYTGQSIGECWCSWIRTLHVKRLWVREKKCWRGERIFGSCQRLDMAKQVKLVWPATHLTHNPIDQFKNDPFWLVTCFDLRPDWPDPNRTRPASFATSINVE